MAKHERSRANPGSIGRESRERVGLDAMDRENGPSGFPRDPIIEEYKKHLDVSLLLESLKRTPQERIEAIMQMAMLVEELRKSTPGRPSDR
jgi:hypothetical protein